MCKDITEADLSLVEDPKVCASLLHTHKSVKFTEFLSQQEGVESVITAFIGSPLKPVSLPIFIEGEEPENLNEWMYNVWSAFQYWYN